MIMRILGGRPSSQQCDFHKLKKISLFDLAMTLNGVSLRLCHNTMRVISFCDNFHHAASNGCSWGYNSNILINLGSRLFKLGDSDDSKLRYTAKYDKPTLIHLGLMIDHDLATHDFMYYSLCFVSMSMIYCINLFIYIYIWLLDRNVNIAICFQLWWLL